MELSPQGVGSCIAGMDLKVRDVKPGRPAFALLWAGGEGISTGLG